MEDRVAAKQLIWKQEIDAGSKAIKQGASSQPGRKTYLNACKQPSTLNKSLDFIAVMHSNRTWSHCENIQKGAINCRNGAAAARQHRRSTI